MGMILARMRLSGQAILASTQASFVLPPPPPPPPPPPGGGGGSTPGVLPDRVVTVLSGAVKQDQFQQSTSPNIRDSFSPLDALAMTALRRYGEFSPSTVDGDVLLMFIDLANEVIDEIHVHPYWTGLIPYFNHQSDFRPIPDTILLSGLLAKFSRDRGSSKAGRYETDYMRRMNSVLYTRKFGTPDQIEISAFDRPIPAKAPSP